VFKDRVLRKICGPKSGKVRGWWRRPHNEELYDLYSSPNIVLIIILRSMRWFGHVEQVGTGEVHTGFWLGKLEGMRPLGRPR
jgi:hypothetical protein